MSADGDRGIGAAGGNQAEPGGMTSSPGSSGAQPGQPGSGDAGADTPEAPPPIEPPNLDLEAREKSQRVAKHLRSAWNALRGPRKDPDLAIREARAALAADSTSIDAVVVIAHAYYTKRLYDTAEVVLDMLYNGRKTAKSNPGVFYVYGLIYDRTERPAQARKAYEQAVRLAPKYKSALINLGGHYLRNKDYSRAISTYERITGELAVHTAVTWTNLGSAYRGRSGDYPAESPQRAQLLRKAESAYKRAVSVDRTYGNAYYNLGLLYLDADPFPAAGGGAMDRLKRLERAKTYFDEYRTMSAADIDLVNRRTKQVNKLIKREQKRRKRAAKQKKS